MLTGLVRSCRQGITSSLILPGETGFICDDFQDYRRCAVLLCQDTRLRSEWPNTPGSTPCTVSATTPL